ncbi:sensor domain-containing diguanylate cyclase [Azospirillum doebereinerae]|uniref:sensor domain-containing diguanylate cyclase n=1 Tax=Azospirillum doebereinerae TaxID=92933 RepID=UPI001EE571BC|nr:sensor domain-containing diguanylate cyclase [Azospirillum doebereinerae]MCG5242303.1 sensor domain-containing diguanylate cyclase [Azospirillum doebereinerae]
MSAHTVGQLTRPLLELLELVTGLESTYLTRIDAEAGLQTILFSRNSKTMQIPEGLSVPWNDTLCKRALEEGRLYTDDVAACWGDSEAARSLGIQTYASTPVYLDDDVLYGTLCAASAQSQPISQHGQQVLLLFSTLIAQQIQREHLLERLQKANTALEAESSTDALTGLPNRRFTLAALQRLFALAQRTRQRVLIAFIDLDGFKGINDTYGHEAGDAFLVEVGRRLASGLRTGDVVGRLGGDEFIVIGLTEATEADERWCVEMTRQRFAPLLEGQFDLGGCIIDYPGASVGVIAADPSRTSPEEAVRMADARMYLEKRRRREESGSAER